MVLKMICLAFFILIILGGKKAIKPKQREEGAESLRNVMGDLGRLELFAFPAGIYLLHVLGKESVG